MNWIWHTTTVLTFWMYHIYGNKAKKRRNANKFNERGVLCQLEHKIQFKFKTDAISLGNNSYFVPKSKRARFSQCTKTFPTIQIYTILCHFSFTLLFRSLCIYILICSVCLCSKKRHTRRKLWWKIIEFRDTTMLKMSWSKTLRILSELILFPLSKTVHTLYSLNST